MTDNDSNKQRFDHPIYDMILDAAQEAGDDVFSEVMIGVTEAMIFLHYAAMLGMKKSEADRLDANRKLVEAIRAALEMHENVYDGVSKAIRIELDKKREDVH